MKDILNRLDFLKLQIIHVLEIRSCNLTGGYIKSLVTMKIFLKKQILLDYLRKKMKKETGKKKICAKINPR